MKYLVVKMFHEIETVSFDRNFKITTLDLPQPNFQYQRALRYFDLKQSAVSLSTFVNLYAKKPVTVNNYMCRFVITLDTKIYER